MKNKLLIIAVLFSAFMADDIQINAFAADWTPDYERVDQIVAEARQHASNSPNATERELMTAVIDGIERVVTDFKSGTLSRSQPPSPAYLNELFEQMRLKEIVEVARQNLQLVPDQRVRLVFTDMIDRASAALEGLRTGALEVRQFVAIAQELLEQFHYESMLVQLEPIGNKRFDLINERSRLEAALLTATGSDKDQLDAALDQIEKQIAQVDLVWFELPEQYSKKQEEVQRIRQNIASQHKAYAWIGGGGAELNQAIAERDDIVARLQNAIHSLK